MVSFNLRRGAAIAALLATTSTFTGTAFAQSVTVLPDNANAVIRSTGLPSVTQPGPVSVTTTTTEIVTGGYADVTECFKEGASLEADRGRLPACPEELADLGELRTLEAETIVEPVQVQEVQQVQQVQQVQAVEPVELDLASVTRGVPCGAGTGVECASNFADLQNVRSFYGTTTTTPLPATPAPAPVAAISPPPPPPPAPVVTVAAPTVVAAPVAALPTAGLGAGALIAGGVGLAALAGIVIAAAVDDDDSTSSTSTAGSP